MDDKMHSLYSDLQNTNVKNLSESFILHLREMMIGQKITIGTENWTTSSLLEFCHSILYSPSTEALFGDVNPLSFDQQYRILDSNIRYLFALFPNFIYSLFFQRILNARKMLVEKFVTKANADNQSAFIKNTYDVLSSQPGGFKSHDVGAMAVSFLWASLGNTIPALFWVLYHILTNKQALDEIREEIQSNLNFIPLEKDSEFDEQAWADGLNKCVKLESAINETLRLHIGSMFMRYTNKPVSLSLHDGRKITILEKDSISLFPRCVYYNEQIFEEANVFKFDRFMNNKVNTLKINEEKLGSIAFSPFGFGKGICPGRFLVKNEIKSCLAVVIQHVNIDICKSIIPIFNSKLTGFGVEPPIDDVPIRYQYKPDKND